MRKTSRSLLALFAIIALLFVMMFALTLTGCGDDDETPAPDPQEGPETGLYYYDDNGTEYTLQLHSINQFTLYNGVTKAGTYTITESGALSFTFAKEADGTATGTLANGVLTFTYKNAETRFLRKTAYSVSFDTDGGSEIAKIYVVNGKYATHPEDPEKADHVFLGWYSDEACKTPFVFASTAITSDITLYARWAHKAPGVPEYNISFEGADVADMSTIGGKLYDLPTPVKDGYTFGGWWISMSDKADKLTAQYDASYTFTSDATLYALWIAAGNNAPVVQVTEDEITWNNVSDATHYPVKITDPSGAVVYNSNVTGTSLSYSFTTAGEYKIEVTASVAGTATETTVRYYTAKALASVYKFTIVEPSTIVFNKVPGAQEYILNIVCGNPAHNHTAYNNGNSTVYNFANCDMIEGGISFTVTARAYGFADSVSRTFTFERKLDAVTDIAVENDIVTWSPVANATTYVIDVTVGDKTYSYTTDAFDYNLKYVASGAVSISIKATAKGYLTSPATTYTYNKGTLATPTNTTVFGNEIKWDAVAGENVSYAVYINGAKYPAATNSLNLADVSLSANQGDTLNIWVTSVSGNVESLASDTVTVAYRTFAGSLTYKKNTLYWPVVVGLDGEYEIRVNSDTTLTANASSINLAFNKSGVNTVSVRFVSDTYTSAWITTEINVYTITFDTRQGSGVNDIYFVPGDYVELPMTSVREGYTFGNWYNTSGANGKIVTDGIFDNVGNIVLYARWSANTYTVTFEVESGADGVVSGTTMDILFGEMFKFGTVKGDIGQFVGWSTGADGAGVQLTDDQGNAITKWNIAENITVYPKFAINVLEYIETIDGTWAVKAGSAVDTVTKVIIPDTYQGKPITTILENAFPKNATMKSISIPNTVTVIGVGAFNTAYYLESIEIREVEGAVKPVFSSHEGALIKNDVGGKYLEVVPRQKSGTFTVPADVDAIRSRAFQYTNLITKVIISNDVTRIAEQAFFHCSRLTEIEFINEGTKELVIEDGAFYDTEAVTTLKLPARLTSISAKTLDALPKLGKIYVEDGGANYGAADGLLTNGANTIIYAPVLWSGELVIPVGITTIAPGAFKDRAGITSVVIPSWVTEIGESAFANIKSITSVTIEGGKFYNLTIGNYAFANCTSIETLTIAGGSSMDDGALIIGDYAFAGNTKLATPIIAENANLTKIGAYAFNGCTNITEVIIQKTITDIGDKAFAQCSKIKNVGFAENGANVNFGSFVFEGCQGINSITLPSTITTFDGTVFAGCNNIAAIIVDEDNPAFSSFDGVLYDKNVTTILYYPRAKAVDMAALPETVTKIGNATFQSNASIKELVIPARITEIGEMAFEGCSELTSIVFEGSGDVALGNSVFANCQKLASVALRTGMTAISEKAFYLAAISAIELPDTISTIGAFAFAKTTLTGVTLPGSVTKVYEGAFSDCTKLATVTALDGEAGLELGVIGATVGVFEGSTNITKATLPVRITVIGDRTFYNNTAKLTTLTLPADSDLTTIGNQAFYNCKKLSVTLNLPEGLTEIGNEAFYYVQGTNFKTLTIPSTVTKIGASAFYYCNKLTTVTFAEGGNASLEFGEKMFYGCSALVNITLPARLDKAYSTINTAGGLELTNFYTMFTSCSKLQHIYVGDGCTKYSDIDGIFCENDAQGNPARVIYCPLAYPTATVTIPHTITKVDNNAFNKCTKVTTIIFEDTPNWDGTPTLVLGDGYYSGFDAKTDGAVPVFGGTYLTKIDLPVQLKSIGCATFYGLKSTKGVAISFDENSAAINIVGQYAFYDTYVTSLALPKVASLSSYALSKNTKMATLTFAEGSTFDEIPNNALYDNKALVAFEVPASVKKIGANAFTGSGTYSNNKLASITFAEGSQLQSIGDKAFSNIPLTSFTFPENVTTIGANIFASCGALTEITLNSKMKNLYAGDGSSFVAGVNKLEKINVHPDNQNLAADEYGVLYSKDGKQLIFCPPQMKIEGEYKIPDTVISIEANALASFGKYDANTKEYFTTLVLSSNLVSIGESALSGAYLTSIRIPATVQLIDDKAFAGAKIASITFDDNSALTKIGLEAFSGCANLSTFDMPDSVTEIGADVFRGCNALTTVDLSAGLVALPTNTFYGCSKLTTIGLKEGLERIEGDVFYGCSSLETITFPVSLRSITTNAYGVFYKCSSLKSIVFPENSKIADIAGGLLVDCDAVTSFTLPATVVVLNRGIISGCDNIESITISGNITSIPDGMFKGFTNLKSINIPATVTEIGASAFEGCVNLESIVLPDGLVKIGDSAFRGCSALTAVSIGANVSEIGNYAFENCTALASVEFASGNAIEKLGAAADVECAIFRNTPALTTITLPDSVKVIGARIFENSGIENIHLPASLTAISEYAFLGCANLQAIAIPDSVKNIYSYAFESCTALTNVAMGFGTESFGTAIFMNCTSLKSVNIPATVSSMAGNPFINCPALTNIDFDNTNADYVFENNMILDADKFTLIYYSPVITDATPNIPESVRIYASGAFYGSQIKSFEIPATLTEISDILFMDCKNLESITFPGSIIKIGDRAFMGCASLTSVTIPETIATVGAYAFAECSSLSSINFAERRAEITLGAHVFEGCVSLEAIELPETITGLAPYMFANTGMVTYTIPSFITNVNVEGVFANNSKLETVVMHANVGDTLGAKFFMNCTAMTTYKIPDSILFLGELIPTGADTNMNGYLDAASEVYGYAANSPSYAFAGCTSLTSINLNKASFIGAHAFDGCTNLATITWPSKLATIGDYAFANCSSLTTLTLNGSSVFNSVTIDGVTVKYTMAYIDIGKYAFANCTGLTSVTFKGNSYWGTLGDGAFAYCTNIPTLTWKSSKYNEATQGPKVDGNPFIGWTEDQVHTAS